MDADTNITERARQWLAHPVVPDVESARPIAAGQFEALARMFRRMEDVLNRDGRSYIHCSAGIHLPE